MKGWRGEDMRKLIRIFGFVLLCAGIGTVAALAQTVEEYIGLLKDKSPKVRANAAYELGCG